MFIALFCSSQGAGSVATGRGARQRSEPFGGVEPTGGSQVFAAM
jgi:hypothetical protein